MAIAHKVQDYMAEHGVRYDIVTHAHSHNSMETAEVAHIPEHRLAKSVPEIYFEAGDHEQLIHMDRDQFAVLMEHAGHARFAHA